MINNANGYSHATKGLRYHHLRTIDGVEMNSILSIYYITFHTHIKQEIYDFNF